MGQWPQPEGHNQLHRQVFPPVITQHGDKPPPSPLPIVFLIILGFSTNLMDLFSRPDEIILAQLVCLGHK